MRLFYILTLSLVLLNLVVSACGGIATEVLSDSESPIPMAEPEKNAPASPLFTIVLPTKPASTDDAEVVSEDMVGKAKNDLMERLGISEDQIQVADARSVVWPDASLGCPQPGMAYAQVITPGYWILLEASGSQYPYHSDRSTQLVLCQEESSPLFPVKPGEIDDGQPWMPVN